MNIDLLLKVKEQILLEPRQFNMDDWFIRGEHIPNCGTAACIGGWAMSIVSEQTPAECGHHRLNNYKHGGSISPQRTLELNSHQSSNLFYATSWPEPWKSDYANAQLDEDHAKAARVAADYIDFFIEHKGKFTLMKTRLAIEARRLASIKERNSGLIGKEMEITN